MSQKTDETTEININLVERLKKSRFYIRLSKVDRGRYLELLGQIYDDTAGELGETEYENLVTLSYICEQFEKHFSDVGIDGVDTRMFSEYRRAKEIILQTMQKNREGRLASKETLNEAKEVLAELRKKGKLGEKMLDLELHVVEDTRPQTITAGKRRIGKIVDSSATEDTNGNSHTV